MCNTDKFFINAEIIVLLAVLGQQRLAKHLVRHTAAQSLAVRLVVRITEAVQYHYARKVWRHSVCHKRLCVVSLRHEAWPG